MRNESYFTLALVYRYWTKEQSLCKLFQKERLLSCEKLFNLINFGCINFQRICEIPGKKYGFIFRPGDMLNMSLNFNDSQPIHAFKHYAYKKEYIVFRRGFQMKNKYKH